jgi:hypothetical protein
VHEQPVDEVKTDAKARRDLATTRDNLEPVGRDRL